MSDVKFEDEGKARHVFYSAEEEVERPSRMTSFVIKLGLAKSKNSANKVMVVIAIISFVMAGVVFVLQMPNRGGGVTYVEDLSPEELEQLPPGLINTLPSRNE